MDVVFRTPLPPASPLRAAIRKAVRPDETEAARRILEIAAIPAEARERIAERARNLVAAVRRERHGKGGIDAFLQEYALSSDGGVALLCLAEALLRIPDAETVDRLIRDKLGDARLAEPSRPFRLGVCQRLDLGLDADRQVAAHRAGGSMTCSRRSAPVRRALRRAAGAPGGDRGDAHPSRQFVMRPHDRGGAGRGPRPPSDRAIAIPTICSARRPAPPPMPRAIMSPTRHAIAAIGGVAAVGGRGRRRRRAGHLGQIVGAAPALRDGAARAGMDELTAEPDRAGWRRPGAPASASRSTPRRPTASICRST